MIQQADFRLESCVVSLAQALAAEQRGADRVELCIRLETEGMTPDLELLSSLCDHLHIPVRVMIRETTAGYEADEQIVQRMIDAMDAFRHLPLDGFVFGVMKDMRIDREAMTTLLHHAYPFHVTFHKAIDLSEDVADDIGWLNQYAHVDTLLTSGGAIKAVDGTAKILEMKSKFNGHIMAAGKITPDALPALHDALHLKWYHGRAIV